MCRSAECWSCITWTVEWSLDWISILSTSDPSSKAQSSLHTADKANNYTVKNIETLAELVLSEGIITFLYIVKSCWNRIDCLSAIEKSSAFIKSALKVLCGNCSIPIYFTTHFGTVCWCSQNLIPQDCQICCQSHKIRNGTVTNNSSSEWKTTASWSSLA